MTLDTLLTIHASQEIDEDEAMRILASGSMYARGFTVSADMQNAFITKYGASANGFLLSMVSCMTIHCVGWMMA